MGLQRQRVAPGAAAAYWLGNPTLNPATIVFIGFVLGWRWALLRVLAGVALVLGAGLWINWAMGGAAAVAPVVPPPEDVATTQVWRRWAEALRGLAAGVIPEWLIIVLLLGAARAWLFPAMSPALGRALWLLPAMVVAGTLFVIPTAGEVPILQVLGRYGMGPGPLGALLLALPAISLPSMIMVGRGSAAATGMVLRAAAAVVLLSLVTGLVSLALHL